MNAGLLLQLVAILAPLSLVGVGGAFTVIPEIYRQVVDVRGWLTDAEFAGLFALAQAAPGPNILVVSLIGWKVAGPLGGLVALLAMTGPHSLLAFGVAQLWRQPGGSAWRRAVQAGLAPVAIGLVLASSVVLASGAARTPLAYVVMAATALLILRSGVHPLLLMAAAAVLAIVGWL